MSDESKKTLSHTFVQAPDSAPSEWMVVLHGVFGMGINFRSFVKGIAERQPEWGFVLVDLRGHGTSQGFEPPHTIASAAEDVHELVQSLAIKTRGIIGHSFGGKVALSYLAAHPGELAYAFILDSVPGPFNVRGSRGPSGTTPPSSVVEGAEDTLSFLESIHQPLPSRDAFTAASAAHGHSKGVTEWLAMNVRREGDGFALRLDLPAIRAMLEDYHRVDDWPAVSDRSVSKELTLVIGGASNHFSSDDIERARNIEKTSERVSVEILAGAGHWLHVDDPRGLSDIVIRSLTRTSGASTRT